MKGVTNTQIAQYWVLITAYTHPGHLHLLSVDRQPDSAARLGGCQRGPEPMRGVPLLDKLDQVLTDLGFRPVHAPAGRHAQHLPLSPVPDDRHRGPAPRHHPLLHRAPGRDARSSAGWALVFIAILYTTAPAVAAIARMNLIQSRAQRRSYAEAPAGSRTGRRPAWSPGRTRTATARCSTARAPPFKRRAEVRARV